MNADIQNWSRLILWRPRTEFRIPPSWEERPWIPLGDLRPLLHAVSPVRDLSDIWRSVAVPLSLADVEAALRDFAGLKERADAVALNASGRLMDLWVEGQALQVDLVLAALPGFVERIELTDGHPTWLCPLMPEARQSMLVVAGALRTRLGCRAAAL